MSRYRRWNELLELLAADGQLQVERAAQLLGVSAATVRRDFDELARQQMLTRIRGGAVAKGVTYDLPLRYKTERHPSEKQRIAAVAAALVLPGHSAGSHDLDVLADGEFGGDVQRVGDDGEPGRRCAGVQVGADGERPGDLGGRGAPVEAGDLARQHERGGHGGDPLLFRGVALGLVTQRQIVGDPLGDRAAPDAREHLLLGQLVEVAPHGGRRHTEHLRGALHLQLAVGRQQFQQLVPAAITAQPVSPLPGSSCKILPPLA